MSKRITTLQTDDDPGAVGFGSYAENASPNRFKKVLFTVSAIVLFLIAVAAVGSYVYWQTLKTTPQYSLALIVDAARRDDQASIEKLIDTSAVVDDFVPQITSKAVEIYGRGLPPQTIARVAQAAEPVMPAVKERARAELPGVIRRKTEQLKSVPFAAMVIGAGRYLDIQMKGDTADVKSLLPNRPLEFKMKREGTLWKIVGVTDNELSERIAKAIGQEFIAAATTNGKTAAGERLGIKNLNELLKNAEEALK